MIDGSGRLTNKERDSNERPGGEREIDRETERGQKRQRERQKESDSYFCANSISIRCQRLLEDITAQKCFQVVKESEEEESLGMRRISGNTKGNITYRQRSEGKEEMRQLLLLPAYRSTLADGEKKVGASTNESCTHSPSNLSEQGISKRRRRKKKQWREEA